MNLRKSSGELLTLEEAARVGCETWCAVVVVARTPVKTNNASLLLSSSFKAQGWEFNCF